MWIITQFILIIINQQLELTLNRHSLLRKRITRKKQKKNYLNENQD